MKVSALVAATLAATTSAYRLDLWQNYDYQGRQQSYVRSPIRMSQTMN